DITTISPAGTTGPGGIITFSEIGALDPTSANVNTDFTALGPIPVTATVSGSPIAIYGSNVNDTAATWTGFTASIIDGSATFHEPNNPFDPYGTYSDLSGWSVSLANQDRTAVFSGGSIAPGDALDTFLGLVVTDLSSPITISLAAIIPEPPSWVLAAVGT